MERKITEIDESVNFHKLFFSVGNDPEQRACIKSIAADFFNLSFKADEISAFVKKHEKYNLGEVASIHNISEEKLFQFISSVNQALAGEY